MTHEHSHQHNHAPSNFGVAFAVATVLNIGIVVLQVIFGLLSHSTALLADAAHNAGDVIGLILAWVAYILAQRQPTGRFTYGMRSSTILAALLNGMILLVAMGAIAWEAVRRFFEPVPIEAGTVMAIAGLAILLNGFSAWLLSRGQKNDINIRSAYWHLVSDAAVSAGVVLSALLILKTGAVWLDSVSSLVITAVVLWSTWRLMREALRLSLQAVPSSIDIEKVKVYLSSLPNVVRIHDLHVWPMSTTETALTCHLVVRDGFDVKLLSQVSAECEHQFGIGHCTVQLEKADGAPCKLAPEVVV